MPLVLLEAGILLTVVDGAVAVNGKEEGGKGKRMHQNLHCQFSYVFFAYRNLKTKWIRVCSNAKGSASAFNADALAENLVKSW